MIKIRIAHISDIHIGPYSGPFPLARYQDIERILEWTADRIIEEKVDLCLIAGDLYKDAKVMFDRGTEETICIGNWLRKISRAGIEVIVISGTPSHDSVAGYKFLKEMQIPKVRIHTKPEISTVEIADYHPYYNGKPNYTNYSIACLPGLNRSALLTQDEYKGLPPEQVHRIMTDKITQLCVGMSAQMPNYKPKILMAHMTYQGADKGFDDLLMQHEPILTKEAVSGFDLVCLGHIHRPQIIDEKVFYSGPIERLSFNDEDITPGFWIHELDSDPSQQGGYQFIKTPARAYKTIEWDEASVRHYLEYGPIIPSLKDAIVRLRYSCSEEIAKQVNRKRLEQSLHDSGAWYVAEIKAEVERTDRARDREITESLTPLSALEKWCVNQGIEKPETKELTSMASGLMEG